MVAISSSNTMMADDRGITGRTCDVVQVCGARGMRRSDPDRNRRMAHGANQMTYRPLAHYRVRGSIDARCLDLRKEGLGHEPTFKV